MKKHLTHTLFLFSIASVLLVSCKKQATAPSVTTIEVTLITQNTAKTGCTVTDDGGADVTRLGLCWSTSPNPTVSDSIMFEDKKASLFPCTINWLTANTTYYLRAYATNSEGTGYGNTLIFNTLSALLPEVKGISPTNVTQTTAQCGGEVTSDGGAPTTRGVCWSTGENPTTSDSKIESGAGLGVFSITITGLTANTTYYVKPYATNIVGTVYGSTIVLRTMQSTVTDIDGNVYPTVLIGTQEWMAENLKVTHYRNGDLITNITDNTQWVNNTTQGAWCSYNNDAANKTTYGLLYNYYTIADSRGVCPTGWHVPSDAEWDILINYLGGVDIAGYKMKKTGERIDSDNSSGFTALMGGDRSDYDGRYLGLKGRGSWWSSTGDQYNAWSRYINSTEKSVHRDGPLNNAGISIRCLKDN